MNQPCRALGSSSIVHFDLAQIKVILEIDRAAQIIQQISSTQCDLHQPRIDDPQ